MRRRCGAGVASVTSGTSVPGIEEVAEVVRSEVAAGTRLVLVRHGEAVSNVEDIVAGHEGCRGLTDWGRRQCGALVERLRSTKECVGAAALYSSVLPRARETAEIISPALGGLEPRASCALCERHPGEADGLSWEEYERRYGRLLPGDDPERPLSPGGESWVQFCDRVEAALYGLCRRHPRELVVVACHGGVVEASLVRLLGLVGGATAPRLYPDHTSLTEWCHTGRRWWLVRYNDAAHLDAAGLRRPAPDWVLGR